MLTKGDVLAFMGQASTPTGTWKAVKESVVPKDVKKGQAAPVIKVACSE